MLAHLTPAPKNTKPAPRDANPRTETAGLYERPENVKHRGVNAVRGKEGIPDPDGH